MRSTVSSSALLAVSAALGLAATLALAPARAEEASAAPAEGGPQALPTAAPAPAAAASRPKSLETVVTAPRDLWRQAVPAGELSGVDPGEALSRLGAASKVRKAGVGNDFALRGLKRDDLSVTVDGNRLFGACPNRMDPPSAHVESGELDSLEVRRGPFDVTVPGGIGGGVELTTRKPRAGVHPDLSLSYGSFQDLDAVGALSWAGRAGHFALGGSYRQAEPFASGDGTRMTELYPQTSPNRFRSERAGGLAFQNGGAWAKGGYELANGHRLQASYGRVMMRDVAYPYLLMDAVVDDADRVSLGYRFDRWRLLREGSVDLFYGYVRHDMSDVRRCSSALNPASCEGELPETWGMRTTATAQTFGARLKATLGEDEASGWGETVLGLDADDRLWDATTTRVLRGAGPLSYSSERSMPRVEALRAGLFAENRHRLFGMLRLLVGLRLDFSSTTAREDRTALYQIFHPEAGSTRSRFDAMPSGNARLEWAVLDELTALLGIGHAQRAPDPQERFFALSGMGGKPGTVGDPGLYPVGNTEADLGLRYGSSSVQVRAQVFFGRLTHYVIPGSVAAADAGGAQAKTYRSVEAHLYGAEATGTVRLPFGLSLRLGVAYTEGQNLSDAVPLAEISPLTANAALRLGKGPVFIEIEERYAARQNRVDPNLQEPATPAWFVTDLRLGVLFHGARLSAEVRNLLNKQYYEHLSYSRDPFTSGIRVPEPGTSLLATVSYEM
ncbi:MAG TPA: TonB-dependent receptor [Myxococcales bacterium]|jgi:iron complex outermembrane receptor protein